MLVRDCIAFPHVLSKFQLGLKLENLPIRWDVLRERKVILTVATLVALAEFFKIDIKEFFNPKTFELEFTG